MSYSMPQQPVRRGKPWLLISGAVLLLVSLALCGIGGFTTFSQGQDLADQPEQTGSHTVQLAADESIAVWSSSETNACSATGPGGPVSDAASGTQNVSMGGTPLYRNMVIEADQAGDYTITCASPFVVGDSLGVGGFAALGIGSALCCLASILVIIGFVLWLIKRKK